MPPPIVVQLLRGAVLWQSGMDVDADGAPHCYHLDSGQGLDRLENAGPNSIAKNAKGERLVQGHGDPAPGFYVSQTALCDRSKAESDQTRYVDAATVPYVVVPKDVRRRYAIHMGDVAVVLYRAATVGAVIADVGPRDHYGEGSIALAQALGIPSSPRAGGVPYGVTWLLFPGSGRGWPRANADVQGQALALFDAWGGRDAIPWFRPIV